METANDSPGSPHCQGEDTPQTNGHATHPEEDRDQVVSPSHSIPPWSFATSKHARGNSVNSIDARPQGIVLEDHTETPTDSSFALWARNVNIDDYTVVSGSRTGVGAYVVWNCHVQTLEVSSEWIGSVTMSIYDADWEAGWDYDP
jgi:hypothetical protein